MLRAIRIPNESNQTRQPEGILCLADGRSDARSSEHGFASSVVASPAAASDRPFTQERIEANMKLARAT